MDIKPTPDAGPQPQSVIEQPGIRTRAWRGWFIAFWVVVVPGFLMAGFVGWRFLSAFSESVGDRAFWVGIPLIVGALAAYAIHSGLRYNNKVAKIVLLVAAACVASLASGLLAN